MYSAAIPRIKEAKRTMTIGRSPWMTRLAFTSVAAATVVATAAPVYAGDAEPYLNASMASATIAGSGMPGKVLPVYTLGAGAEDATVTFDVSGLAGVADVKALVDCDESVTSITCPLPSGPDFFDVVIPLELQAVDGVAASAKGTLSFTTKATNVEPTTNSATITIANGIDLVVLSGEQEIDSAKPGDVLKPDPVDFYNAGNESAAGFTLTVGFDSGLVPDQYENCDYSTDRHRVTMVCSFDGPVAPGDEMSVSGLEITVAPDAAGGKGVDYFVLGSGESTLPSAMPMQKGTGTKRLIATRMMRPKSAPSDIDQSDNFGLLHIKNVVNKVDVAALATTITGAVGETVKAKIGVKNAGAGTLDAYRSRQPVVSFVLIVPSGVQVVAAPSRCASIVDTNGTQYGTDGAAGGTYYRCGTDTYFGAGTTFQTEFTFKIISLAGKAGSVSLNDKYASPATFNDDNPADNTAPVTVTAPSSGGSGGGIGLPVTGAKAGIIGGAGGALLVAGALAYVLARRRRVVLVSGVDEKPRS